MEGLYGELAALEDEVAELKRKLSEARQAQRDADVKLLKLVLNDTTGWIGPLEYHGWSGAAAHLEGSPL